MKKSLLIISLVMFGNAHAALRWCQPDEEKPKQAFDYFIGGEDETCYVQLNPEAKATLKKMLDDAQEDEELSSVIRRVQSKVRTQAGKEALQALKEMAANDDQLPAGVVKDGIFGDPQKLKRARAQRSQ